MLPNREGEIAICTTLDGEVELRAPVGTRVATGQILAIVEGECELESLSVRNPSEVVAHCVECGSEVTAGTTLMRVREVDD